MKKIQINLGCGVDLAPGFINVDKHFSLEDLLNGIKTKKGLYQAANVPKGAEFVQADMCALPFKNSYADYIESCDAIEHISHREIQKAFNEMFRVLKKGGKLVLMTSDFDNLAELWLKQVRMSTTPQLADIQNLTEIIYGNQIGEGEYHKIAFNPTYICYLLQQAGFKAKNIQMKMFPWGCKTPWDLKALKFKPGQAYRSDTIQCTVTK